MNIVTLTTDLGTEDYFSAMLKAEILTAAGNDHFFVDISHNIAAHDIQQAAYFLQTSYSKFPQGTIHVAFVYSYYNPAFEYIAFYKNGHFFIGPNNGLFSLLFDDLTEEDVYLVEFDDRNANRLVAHAVACIKNNLFPDELGRHPTTFNRKLSLRAVITNNNIRATVIHKDHFDNVVLNVTKANFEKMRDGRNFELFYKQSDPITRLSKHYGDVAVGDVLCLFNSADLLEIAVNMGKAGTYLGLNKNETVQIYFKER